LVGVGEVGIVGRSLGVEHAQQVLHSGLARLQQSSDGRGLLLPLLFLLLLLLFWSFFMLLSRRFVLVVAIFGDTEQSPSAGVEWSWKKRARKDWRPYLVLPYMVGVGVRRNGFGGRVVGWREDNGNRSNQESKFDFLATRQCLVKIYKAPP